MEVFRVSLEVSWGLLVEVQWVNWPDADVLHCVDKLLLVGDTITADTFCLDLYSFNGVYTPNELALTFLFSASYEASALRALSTLVLTLCCSCWFAVHKFSPILGVFRFFIPLPIEARNRVEFPVLVISLTLKRLDLSLRFLLNMFRDLCWVAVLQWSCRAGERSSCSKFRSKGLERSFREAGESIWRVFWAVVYPKIQLLYSASCFSPPWLEGRDLRPLFRIC